MRYSIFQMDCSITVGDVVCECRRIEATCREAAAYAIKASLQTMLDTEHIYNYIRAHHVTIDCTVYLSAKHDNLALYLADMAHYFPTVSYNSAIVKHPFSGRPRSVITLHGDDRTIVYWWWMILISRICDVSSGDTVEHLLSNFYDRYMPADYDDILQAWKSITTVDSKYMLAHNFGPLDMLNRI